MQILCLFFVQNVCFYNVAKSSKMKEKNYIKMYVIKFMTFKMFSASILKENEMWYELVKNSHKIPYN